MIDDCAMFSYTDDNDYFHIETPWTETWIDQEFGITERSVVDFFSKKVKCLDFEVLLKC